MTTSTSGTYFLQAQATMLRLCMGCILCSLIFKMHGAHAAQPSVGTFVPGIDLAAIKLTRFDTNQTVTDRFSASVGPTDKASVGFKFGGTSTLPEYINLEKFTTWVASVRWHLTAEDSRASLSPKLQVESRDALIEIKPLDRSVWMMWHRELD